MAKFKVGDRVRRMAAGAEWAPIGYETIVVPQYGFTGIDGGAYDIFDEKWELVVAPATTAIRTVTRREIVRSYVTLPNGGDIYIEPKDDEVRFDVEDLYFDSTSLRAAAALFNELADVLDEQREAA